MSSTTETYSTGKKIGSAILRGAGLRRVCRYAAQCLLAFLCSYVFHASAELTSGGSVSGAIVTPGQKDTYTFSGKTGDSVVLRVADTRRGTLSPGVTVYGPTGTVLARKYNTDVAKIHIALPASGTYSAVVSDATSTGDQKGPYVLYFMRALGADEGSVLDSGSVQSGMIDPGDLVSFTGSVRDTVTVLAFLVCGAWALGKYRYSRWFQTALIIDFTADTEKNDNTGLKLKRVFLCINLTNKGVRKFESFKKSPKKTNVHEDEFEKIKYSCSLKLRRVVGPDSPGHIDWDWLPATDKRQFYKTPDCLEELDLAKEYYEKRNGQCELLVEPGETCNMGVLLYLEPSEYLAKITFVGKKPPVEMWSRIVHFTVS